jgi:hypothetical protein
MDVERKKKSSWCCRTWRINLHSQPACEQFYPGAHLWILCSIQALVYNPSWVSSQPVLQLFPLDPHSFASSLYAARVRFSRASSNTSISCCFFPLGRLRLQGRNGYEIHRCKDVLGRCAVHLWKLQDQQVPLQVCCNSVFDAFRLALLSHLTMLHCNGL